MSKERKILKKHVQKNKINLKKNCLPATVGKALVCKSKMCICLDVKDL